MMMRYSLPRMSAIATTPEVEKLWGGALNLWHAVHLPEVYLHLQMPDREEICLPEASDTSSDTVVLLMSTCGGMHRYSSHL